jgi:threonyl-tRNA synthetase
MELHFKTKDLTEYLLLLEEAKRRDHRKLGKELELFAFSQKWDRVCLYGYLKELQRERLEQFLKKNKKESRL